MATIYSFASLALLAASGEDADAGLPGFGSSSKRRYEQREVVVQEPSEQNAGLSVMNTLKSYPKHWDEWYARGLEDADFSKWSHRAWTMQEKALSRRTLTFTSEQVFWSCKQAYFCEESFFEIPETSVKHFYPSVHQLDAQQLTARHADPWDLFGELVDNYMRRDLSFQGDVHAAFQAILDTTEQSTKTGFLWGLPLSRLELALSWDTFHGVHRRTALSTLPMTSLKQYVRFPSWSWMGWKGDVHCKVDNARRERYAH